MTKSQNTKSEQLTEKWVNIYKSKKHGNYWSGAFCYKTKEEAVKDLADKENYLTTVNIEDMLQKTENVAKNVANENSQDLTEQWKKGELPVGEEYWVILTDEWYLRNPVEPVRAFYSCDCEFEGYLDDDIKEVLAPVPTFDELQNMNKAVNECMAANIKLVEENKNLSQTLKASEYLYAKSQKEILDLKDLLKECRRYIDIWGYTDTHGNALLPQIDEALK